MRPINTPSKHILIILSLSPSQHTSNDLSPNDLSSHRNLLMGTFQLSVWDHNSNTAHTQIGLAARDVLLKSLLRLTAAVTNNNNNGNPSSSSAKANNSNPTAAGGAITAAGGAITAAGAAGTTTGAGGAAGSAATTFPLEETIKILFTLNHPTTGERVSERAITAHTLSIRPIHQYTISIPLSTRSFKIPDQLTLPTHPFNPSTHLFKPPYQPTLSTHQLTFSNHPFNPPVQPTLSTHPFNPPTPPSSELKKKRVGDKDVPAGLVMVTLRVSRIASSLPSSFRPTTSLSSGSSSSSSDSKAVNGGGVTTRHSKLMQFSEARRRQEVSVQVVDCCFLLYFDLVVLY